MSSKWRVLAVASVVHGTLIGGAYMSLPPLFEMMTLQSGWSLATLERAWSLIPLGSCLSALITAFLFGRYPQGKILRLAILITIASTLARSFAPDASLYALSLFTFGIGTGALLVVLTNLVSQSFSEEEIGSAQAIFFGSYALGAAISIVTADLLASYCDSWRAVPLLWGLLSALAALLVMFDRQYAKSSQEDASHNTSQAIREPALWRYAFVYATFVGAYLGYAGLLPVQLRLWGMSPSVADTSMALSTLLFLVGAYIWGSLTDRVGYRRLTFICCMVALAICAALIPAFATSQTIMFIIVVCVGLFSGAMTLFFPMMLEDKGISRENSSFSIGITTTASYVGGFLVPFLAAPLAESCPSGAIYIFAVFFLLAGLGVPGVFEKVSLRRARFRIFS